MYVFSFLVGDVDTACFGTADWTLFAYLEETKWFWILKAFLYK